MVGVLGNQMRLPPTLLVHPQRHNHAVLSTRLCSSVLLALESYVDQLREDLNQETDPEWRTAIELGIALWLRLLDRVANTGEQAFAPSRANRARLPPQF
jgi:hypothetical protein